MAGLGYRDDAQVLNPYVGDRFEACVVTTDYPLSIDRPLKPSAARKAKNVAYWLGFGGAVSGLERRRQDRRPRRPADDADTGQGGAASTEAGIVL